MTTEFAVVMERVVQKCNSFTPDLKFAIPQAQGEIKVDGISTLILLTD